MLFIFFFIHETIEKGFVGSNLALEKAFAAPYPQRGSTSEVSLMNKKK